MEADTPAPGSLAGGLRMWRPWRVDWSAVSLGALTGVAASVVLGLVYVAIGGNSVRTTFLTNLPDVDIALAILCAFFAYVAAGWATAKVAGIPYAEPAILHAVCAWLVALPVMLALLSFGAGAEYGGWFGGALGASGVLPGTVGAAEMTRSMALASVTAILAGLMGTVLGGWMGSGEPMTFTHHRTRPTVWSQPERDTSA